jgi:thiamine-phosphate pyrophosphorylase
VLCLVVDRRLGGPSLLARVADAVRGGVDWIQIRERELAGSALLAYADSLADAARRAASKRSHPLFVCVNRRVDIALACRADAVQLGFDALDPETARALLPDLRIGVSCHELREVECAARVADYAQLAPIFDPLSKPASRPPLGTSALADAAETGLRILAQGGIDASNAGDVMRAGAAGIAVTGSILAAPDSARAAEGLRAALDRAART